MTAAVAPAPGISPASAAKLAVLKGDAHYWCGQVFTIRDKKGRTRKLVLRPAQRRVGEDERRQMRARGYARQFILKARQGGFSTYEQARALHQVWSRPGFDALTLGDTGDNTLKLFEITTFAVEHFPPELMPTPGDRETREISYPGLNTHFYTGTAGSKKSGRGLTLLRAHLSEFAHYEEPRQVLKAVRGAIVQFGSTIVLETTGSGHGSEGHQFWQEAVAGKNGYVALFFPWWECDPDSYRLPLLAPDELGPLDDEERDLVRRASLTLEQIKWRRATMAEMGRAEFLQEYAEDPETCWISSGGLFYDADLLKVLQGRAQAAEAQPIRVEDNGCLEVYSELREGERAIIGCDTAEGGGGDRSAWTARAFPSWRKLAVYKSPHVEPKELASGLNHWGRHYRLALLVVEKNAHGITVLRHLRDDHRYPESAIYHRQSLDAAEAQDGVQGKIGWHTSAESKPLLLDAGRELLTAARDGHAEVPSVDALRDAFGVRRGPNGKIELTGKDVLVSEMLAWIGRSAPAPTVPRARLLN